ncbi:cytochrome P450 [Gymnopilus junonius]|uniref:Cytochrome P450 n=1 Tax=Gymnopilus junonius TaxID=109634 RepID=A0A9P5NRN8_GYMJU|nr:cytochrome P450 [Gymnopilus junonius]
MLQGIPLLVGTFGLLYVVRLLVSWWNGVRSIGNLPGYRTLFSHYGIVSRILPRIPFVNPGSNSFFEDKHSSFQAAGWDMISVVSALPQTLVAVSIADAKAVKEVISARARFPKPVAQYKVLTFFGRNIVASEGDEWKRYRKITAPAFSDRNNKLVWDETVKIMNDLFTEVWMDKDVITVDHCVDITLPIALFVIGVAGFGRRISWHDDVVIPPGHTMTYKDALHIVSSDVFFKVLLPDWALSNLGPRMKNIKTAFDELEQYMREMIRDRQNSEKVERYDCSPVFWTQITTTLRPIDCQKVTSIVAMTGNIFIFLLAGHETTAHTLCFAFALLALHPEEQDKLFEQIKSLLPEDRFPTYEEMPLYTYSMAVFNETLRLFPPVVNIPKVSAEDTVLTVGNAFGEKRTVPIPKDARVSVNTPGLHYNPRYWKNPESFQPARFLEPDWPRDAFLPFSAGARACLGRKFFETEGIVVLTMLVSKYKISLKDEPEFAGESVAQCKERIFRTHNGLTLT